MANRFQELMPKNSVFKNEIYLKPSHVPKKLLFRDDKMEKIYSNFKKTIQDISPSHMLIHGPPGTGKTHGILRVISEFNEFSEERGLKWEAKFSSAEKKSYYQLLVKVARDLKPGFPSRGFGESEVQDRILKMIENSGKKYIFIFDEVDKMNKPQKSDTEPLQDLVYFITRANEIANKSTKSIDVTGVLVGNEQGLDKKVASCSGATASAYHPQKVYFDDYHADEVRKILEDRCEKAFKDGIVTRNATSFLAAQITKHTHDLRFGLKVLWFAGGEIKNTDKDKIDETLIRDVIEDVQKSNIENMVKQMNDSKIITLWSIIMGNEAFPLSEKVDSAITSRQFYDVYKKTCQKVGLEKRSQAHITQNVTSSLETQGFVSTKVKGMGRGKGKTMLFYAGEIEGIKEAVRNTVKERYDVTPNIKIKVPTQTAL